MKRTFPASSLAASLFLFAALIFSLPAQARPVRILHTNDLHAYFENGNQKDSGSLAALKSAMDSLREEAARNGMETITLDAGDFSDGTLFRYADRGRAPFTMMDQMGYDAIALGNHDWLIGCKQLDDLLGSMTMSTPILAANFSFLPTKKNLSGVIHPFLSLKKAGLRIAILGLTTSEVVYRWRVQDGTVHRPERIAKHWIPKLRENHDFVILLSHLGLKRDLKLVKKVKGIDLVIGGHSHTLLKAPVFAPDPDGKPVPIVQVGAHGDFLGDLRVNMEPGAPLTVERYQAVPVEKNRNPDPGIAERTRDARTQLETEYGKNWLYEVIAVSEVPMIRPIDGPTVWGSLFTDAMKEIAGADAAIDINKFYGSDQPAGPVTRENLYNFFPRTFDLSSPYGWTIWKMRVPGWVLKLVFNQAHKRGQYVMNSGISWDVRKKSDGTTELTNFRIGGKKMRSIRYYKVAVSEGIGRGAGEIYHSLRSLLLPQDTKIPVWTAVEQKLSRMGRVVGKDPRLP